MAQARKKSPVKKKPSNGSSIGGIVILISGMVIGSLGTVLWQGMTTSEGEVGAGIRKMMEQSRDRNQQESDQEQLKAASEQPVKQQTEFDFYTVLPEIEVVVPDRRWKNAKGESGSEPLVPSSEESEITAVTELPAVEDRSAYMLQAGSYQRQADADKIKAQLGLLGFVSVIQKVTIQGRGDFFRVRLGPYSSHQQMVKVDDRLQLQGIKTLRLKVSREG